MTYEEWRDGLNFNQLRIDQLDEAHELNRGQRPNIKKCHRVESHVKQECYPEYKNARLINSRPDLFKVWFGPMCKTIEKQVYSLTHFVKELTPEERIERISALSGRGEYIYSTDFTAFESHFTPEIMWALEFQLYKHFLPAEDFNHLIQVIGGRNRMGLRNKYRAECDGRRMSGEMSTSLANGFSNLMLAMYLVEKQRGHFNGVVEGDDGLFVLDVPLTNEMYTQLGFTIKIKREESVHEAAFCGLIVSESKQLIKDPRRIMQKFGWTLKYINAKQKFCNGLLRAKGLSLYYELRDCPILGVLARHVIEQTAGTKPIFLQDGYHIEVPDVYKVEPFAPTIDTRLLFQQLFGISVRQQERCESLILAGKFAEITDHIQEGDVRYSAYSRTALLHMADFESRFIGFIT